MDLLCTRVGLSCIRFQPQMLLASVAVPEAAGLRYLASSFAVLQPVRVGYARLDESVPSYANLTAV